MSYNTLGRLLPKIHAEYAVFAEQKAVCAHPMDESCVHPVDDSNISVVRKEYHYDG